MAGIAHVSTNPKLKDLYYRVNRDLAIETAKKAKEDGVKQFIFMSVLLVMAIVLIKQKKGYWQKH